MFDKNVLLTTCRDGVCRLWSETGLEESLRFFMCAFIDPSQGGVRRRAASALASPSLRVLSGADVNDFSGDAVA